MNYKLEEIQESDFESLLALFREFSVFQNLPHKMINSVERMKQEKAYLNGFVAKDEQGNIMAYATYFFAYYTWTGKSLYMDDLFVREQYRGTGLGAKLINKVIDFAKETKCNKVRWMVGGWNKNAIEFYKTMGVDIDSTEYACDLFL